MTSRFVLPLADVGAGITPSSGAKLYFYETGTTTPKNTFSDSAGTVPNANPVVANSLGVFPDIYITGIYKVVLKTADEVQFWAADPVSEYATFVSGGYVTKTELAAAGGSGLVGFSRDDIGAINRTVKDVLEDTILNVRDFGAVGDGVNNDSPAIQAAIDAVVATGVPGTVYIPSPAAYYLCDTGLVVDTTIVSIKGEGALLHFKNLPVNGYAMTLNAIVNGYAGGAYYSSTNYLEGIRFKGREGASEGAPPSPGAELNCFKFEQGPSVVLVGYEVRNCVVNNFTVAVEVGHQAWGFSFSQCHFSFNQTAYYVPTGLLASATNVTFDHCIFQNGKTAFNITSTTGSLTTLTNCTIENHTDNFFYTNGGQLALANCHLETGGSHTATKFFWRDSAVSAGVYSDVSIVNTLMIAKGTRTNPMFDLSNPINLTIVGGQFFVAASTYTGSYFETDGAGTGVGTLTILGTTVAPTASPFKLFDNLDTSIERNVIWANLGSPNHISFTNSAAVLGTATSVSRSLSNYDEGTWVPTAVNLTVTGTPVYSGTYTRIGNIVFCTLTINPSGGTTASTANTTRFTRLSYTIAIGYASAGAVITVNTVDQGGARIEGASVYTPTWGADALFRTVSFQYMAA